VTALQRGRVYWAVLDEEIGRKLTAYRGLVQRAAASLDGRFTVGPQRERQGRILGRSLAVIARALGEGRVTAAAMRDFAREQRADLLDNLRDAAREQITTMHAQVTAWAARTIGPLSLRRR